MTTKRRYEWINHRGETVVTDEDIAPSGFGVRAPVLLMDAKQQQTAHYSSSNNLVVDGLGNPAGNRPGHCYATDQARDVKGQFTSDVEKAREAHKLRVSNSWRGPTMAAPASALTKDEAYDEMTQRLEDAWKLTPAAPGFINERTGKYEAHATGEAVEGRQFYLAEEVADGINARDAAYDAHVQQLSNAWRGSR
jgi:hypothetical protein